jgi:hypothetical protein
VDWSWWRGAPGASWMDRQGRGVVHAAMSVRLTVVGAVISAPAATKRSQVTNREC